MLAQLLTRNILRGTPGAKEHSRMVVHVEERYLGSSLPKDHENLWVKILILIRNQVTGSQEQWHSVLRRKISKLIRWNIDNINNNSYN
jgi:hypothetical protein